MSVLGIYIYNATLKAWYVGDGLWGSFDDAHEFPEGQEQDAEDVRELISGEDMTFVMAALH